MKAFAKVKGWIRTDGQLHILVSTVLMMVCGIWLNWIVSSIVVLCIGILKELYDKVSGKGCAEIHDIICDVVGIIVGIILLWGYAI